VSLGIAEAHGGSLRIAPAAVGACLVLTLPSVTADTGHGPPVNDDRVHQGLVPSPR
jgi:hypothetical protein